MPALNPYLNFNGNAEEAFNFYRSVFGGEFLVVSRFKDMPAEYKASEKEDNLIMHISLPIAGGNYLMGSDVPSSMPKAVTGNNINISLHPDTREEADRLFKGLSAGGNVVMPMADAFWGAYFGMFIDKFGISWMINVETHPK
ncbi:VOC family protein [Niastella caeni]|uniref:VOC family protein n=1 Tax=Niastella caeni TaxID=2569763 RepID=A0A4V4H0M6_9BACT|nr:VOC family protein [Niastella caeni]THU37086.1 VOC family protein [Niastella caeni]